MKHEQLSNVILITILIVAAAAAYFMYANVGKAPGDFIDAEKFKIKQKEFGQQTPAPTPQPAQGGPSMTIQTGGGGGDTYALPTPAPTPAPTLEPGLGFGSSFVDSTTCKEVTGPCELYCEFEEKDSFAMSKEPDIDIEFKCPFTKGILTLGYSLSAGSYRGFDAMVKGGDYKGAYDCARKEGTFIVMVDICEIIDLFEGK
jgi:hypothetical protein